MSYTKDLVKRIFYENDTLTVARDILGKVLVRRTSEDLLMGRIVETEAYRGVDDPASHSYRGRTKRNEVMFGMPGVTYVYFTYGNHYCLNIVTEQKEVPAALLIRALEPLAGIEVMKKNRGLSRITDLTNGPGKLTKAFQIIYEHNGIDVTDPSSPIVIYEPSENKDFNVVQTTRIGIKVATERPWRFYIRGNPYVSRK